MTHATEFEFFDDDQGGGQFVPVAGSVPALRGLLGRGDIDAAVKLYEENGGAARAGLLQEASVGSFELKKAIAQTFKRARDFSSAGQVFELANNMAEAAPCFEAGNEFVRAALAWKKAGELLRAAAAYERAGRIDDAIELYTQAGAREQLAEALARARRYEAAAAVYRELKNLHAEVESLRAALASTPGAVVASMRLAELFAQHGQLPKATELLMDAARVNPEAPADPALMEYLARLLEASNNPTAAARVRAHMTAGAAAVKSSPTPVPAVASAPAAPTTPGGDAYGFLKALPMFTDLSLDDMRSLFRVCTQHGFGPGMHLIEPGQPGRGLFVIVDGQVEVFGGSGPEARLLNTLGVGGYVGEISLLLDGPTSARVTARTPVKALFISREAFTQYLFNTPSAAVRIYRLFSNNLAERVRALSAAR